jgi:hypothetical protein
MRKFVLVVFASGVAVLVVAALAFATTRRPLWTAQLSPKQEVQVVKSPGRGLFKGTLAKGVLSWKLTYSGLSGAALNAAVYKGKRGQVGTVGVPLCAMSHPVCKSGITGSFRVSAHVKRWIDQHLLYVNIHTAKYPNGEIRGQITVH